jgi:hypothetical protein
MKNVYNPGAGFKLRSPYGLRSDPETGEEKFHAGLDFRALPGTPIPAAASGKVIYSGSNALFGNVVIIKNDAGGYSWGRGFRCSMSTFDILTVNIRLDLNLVSDTSSRILLG